MDLATVGYVACAAVIFLLAIRVPISFAIGGVAVTAIFIVFAFRTGTFMPERALWTTLSLAFSSSFDLVHSYDLSMIPLFIALGHIASIWSSHRKALAIFKEKSMAAKVELPMALLMIGYTVISLWIISRPVLNGPLVPLPGITP